MTAWVRGRIRRGDAHDAKPARRSTGIEGFIERHADAYWYYGSGKVALRDAVRSMCPSLDVPASRRNRPQGGPAVRSSESRRNVLLPAYVPDAVAEPLRELGVDPRYYEITSDLEPDEAALARRTDDGTIAIVSIDYFGFPQPGLDIVADHARDVGCYHVDDNAHATLSVSNGRLLGTLGDVGITSLWKTLSIPNGAVCYVSNNDLRDRFEPSDLAGVSGGFTGADVRFLCTRTIRRALWNRPALQRSVDTAIGHVFGSDVPEPQRRYEAAKRPFSKLSARVAARTDPQVVRGRRRQNYRAWLDVLESTAGLRPLFSHLPRGICPQCVPVEADRPTQVRSRLAAAGVTDVHTWPRLPREVATTSTYQVSRHLASHVLALPVDRRVDPERIVSIGASL